uniref:CpGbinding proteinlike [Haplochromis burtoni] n=1 Tax=Lepeophtheirus salmonis TaxID=72036 RepID=A0A0K2SXU4_LEPSM
MVQKRQGKEESVHSKNLLSSSSPIVSTFQSNLSHSNNSAGSSSSTTTKQKAILNERPPLPTQEEHRLYIEGRSPYHCLSCDKRLSKSFLRSHLKNKHPGLVDSLNFACLICSESLTSVGVLNTHYHSELYPCYKCEAKKKEPARFPDFDRLKSHLFNAHNRTQWPWSCSYCDTISFFELDYIVHLRTHSSKELNNFVCPECQHSSRDHSDLREHLIQAHLPQSKKMANDENAVNHEIATLLLNLASRTTQAPPTSTSSVAVVAHHHQQKQSPQQNPAIHSNAFDRPEDLSKGPQQQAMDLSSKKPMLKLPLSIDTAKLKNMTITPVTTTSNGGAINGSQILDQTNGSTVSSSSSVAASSTSNGLNSNYLLQNLLLGKMAQQHQLIVPGAPHSSTIMVPNSTAQHLPKYSLKSNGIIANKSVLPESIISVPCSGVTPSIGQNNNNGSIPLLCGQIVAQLNGLLFLVHDLNSPALENSLQASLGSIYGRLQEIVSLVEQTKTKIDGSSEDLLKHNEIQKQIKESKQKEEDKIAKHIQEYQRALLQQQHSIGVHNSTTIISKSPPSPLPSQIIPTLKETLPVAAANSVVTMLKKQGLEATIKFDGVPPRVPLSFPTSNGDVLHLHHNSETTVSSSPASSSSSSEHMEVESSTGGGRRRRGRPPKNSSDGPTEKKYRESPPNLTLKSNNSHQNIPLHSTPSPVISPSVNGSSKGSKGIRNRVFCGECPGCLKNDDCGRCRYCQDKTKFGGQNRLRQKCLHRRCQMDTHRKRASANAANNSNNANNNINNNLNNNNVIGNTANNSTNNISPAPVLPIVTLSMEETPPKLISIPGVDTAPATIYSGVDLAKIQENITTNKKPPVVDRVTITNSKTKEEVEIKTILEDANAKGMTPKDVVVSAASPINSTNNINNNNNPLVPKQVDIENGEKALVVVSSEELSKENGLEFDEDEDPNSSKNGGLSTSSRIDKWKAKHEAMLKKVKTDDDDETTNGSSSNVQEEVVEQDPSSSTCELPRMIEGSAPSVCIEFEPEKNKSNSLAPTGQLTTAPNPTVNQAVLSV